MPNVREENEREEAAVEVAAGAEEAQEHVDEQVIDEADAEVVAEQIIVDTQEDDDREQRAEDEIGESTTDRTELDEVTRRQEGGEQTLPVAVITTAGVDGPSELEGCQRRWRSSASRSCRITRRALRRKASLSA